MECKNCNYPYVSSGSNKCPNCGGDMRGGCFYIFVIAIVVILVVLEKCNK